MTAITSSFCLSVPVNQEQLSKLPFGNVYLYYREHTELKPDATYQEQLKCQLNRLNSFVGQLAGPTSDINRRPIQLDAPRFKNNNDAAYTTLKDRVKGNYQSRSLNDCLMITINPDTQEEQLEALYYKIQSELTKNQGTLTISPDPRISEPLKLSPLAIECLRQALTDYHARHTPVNLSILIGQVDDAQLELLLPALPTLSQLNLSHNLITEKGFYNLITASGIENLQEINLSKNQIRRLDHKLVERLNQLGADFLAPRLILNENEISNLNKVTYTNLTT